MDKRERERVDTRLGARGYEIGSESGSTWISESGSAWIRDWKRDWERVDTRLEARAGAGARGYEIGSAWISESGSAWISESGSAWIRDWKRVDKRDWKVGEKKHREEAGNGERYERSGKEI